MPTKDNSTATGPVPRPKKKLGSHCSALRGNTLYTFSKDAFQSVTLKKGAKWEMLPHGVPTEGAACVIGNKGTPEEALYIVGGWSADPTKIPANGFMGLQRWVFAKKKWETIPTTDPVVHNLTNHGATYLEATKQIIIFAGATWPTTGVPSANTFLIKSTPPYQVSSVPAQSPLLAPIVLPWGDNGAVIIGGNRDNTNLNSFSPETGWKDLDQKLDKGLPARGQAGASLMNGDDGSRVLLTFDLTTSPTTVQQKVVLQPPSKVRRKRQAKAQPRVSTTPLTAANWPEYDESGAPQGGRAGTSIAYDGDMVVISGGDEQNPILLFNARKNAWEDPQQVLGSVNTEANDRDNTQVTTMDASPSVITSPTSTLEPSPTASPTASEASESPTIVPVTAPPQKGGLSTIQLLFIVLGSILALIVILSCLFYWLKKRRLRLAAAERRRIREREQHLSFQDRGASFMKEAGIGAHSTGHIDSWAAIQRPPPSLPPTSPRIMTGPTIQKVGGQGIVVSHPPPSTHQQGRTGWSRYFSGTPSSTSSTTTSYPNPYLHTAGPGVVAGGGVAVRGSDISMSSIGGDSFSSGIPDGEEEIWSPVGADHYERGIDFRPPVSSSVYPDSRRDTEVSVYSEHPGNTYRAPENGRTREDLSWLNLRGNA